MHGVREIIKGPVLTIDGEGENSLIIKLRQARPDSNHESLAIFWHSNHMQQSS